MVKITFRSATVFSPKWPDRPSHRERIGYLLTSTSHPGRKFVLARETKSIGATDGTRGRDWKDKNTWALFDYSSGVRVGPERHKTRRRLEVWAFGWLANTSPENVAAFLERWADKEARKMLEAT